MISGIAPLSSQFDTANGAPTFAMDGDAASACRAHPPPQAAAAAARGLPPSGAAFTEFGDVTVDGLLAAFQMNDQIYQHARSGSASSAAALLASMIDSSEQHPEPSSYLSVIMAQAKSRDGSARVAMDVLDTVAGSDDADVVPTGIMVNAVLDAHAKCGDGSAVDAYRLLRRMKGIVRLDAISYNTAINCFAKCRDGSAVGAINVYADMKKAGILPTAVTFYSLIDAQARHSDGAAQCVLRLLDDMVCTANIQPEVAMYTNAIILQARSHDGSARGALALLGRMKKAGMHPTVVTLNSVIDAQAKHRDGSARVALQILDAMKRSRVKDVRPTVVTYTSVIDCFAKCGDGDGRTAVALLKEMCTEGVTPNNITYGTCMNAQAKRGSARMAMELLRKMVGQGLTPSPTQFNAVLDAHAKCPDGSAVQALLVLEMMPQHGAAPNVVSYSTCIDAQAKREDGSAETAAQLLLELLERGLVPDTVTFAGVIDAQAKRKDGSAATAATILDRMQDYVRPNQVHFNSVLNACANERPSAIHLAEPVLCEMLAQAFLPNQYTLSALFRCAGFCQPQRPDLGRRWFNTFCCSGSRAAQHQHQHQHSSGTIAVVAINDHVARALCIAVGNEDAALLLEHIGSPLASGCRRDGSGSSRHGHGHGHSGRHLRSERSLRRDGGGGRHDSMPASFSSSPPHRSNSCGGGGNWRQQTTHNHNFNHNFNFNFNHNRTPSGGGVAAPPHCSGSAYGGGGGGEGGGWRSSAPPTSPGVTQRKYASPPSPRRQAASPETPTSVPVGLRAALHTASNSPGTARRSLSDKINDIKLSAGLRHAAPCRSLSEGANPPARPLLAPVFFEAASDTARAGAKSSRRQGSPPVHHYVVMQSRCGCVREPSGPDGTRGFGGRRSTGAVSSIG